MFLVIVISFHAYKMIQIKGCGRVLYNVFFSCFLFRPFFGAKQALPLKPLIVLI